MKISITEIDSFSGGGSYESTPIVCDGRIYISSGNGYFYCLGNSAK